MRILFAGNKERGVSCLDALVANGYEVVSVLAHDSPAGQSLVDASTRQGIPVLRPKNVNHPDVIVQLSMFAPDLTVLAGYGQIVRQAFISIAALGCVNLHGGKLPQYRGSSPMNWALINGESSFTLSIIAVDAGVDTGDVLNERTFPIADDDTIVQLQETANRAFPEMLVEVVAQIETGTLVRRKQDESLAAYYPLRFPDDGLILFDLHTAEQIHNRIRALTDPYPGAFTFLKGMRVALLSSQLAKRLYFGEPGRVYLKNQNGLLVCARDKCLWIKTAVFADRSDALPMINRYDKLATVSGLAVEPLRGAL